MIIITTMIMIIITTMIMIIITTMIMIIIIHRQSFPWEQVRQGS